MKRTMSKSDRIIDAAVKVIAKNGYHGAKVTAIAKEAGVADGTIYLYFKNKEHLLISLFQAKMGSFIEYSEAQIAHHQSATQQLAALIEAHLEQLSVDYDLAVVTQIELRQSNQEMRHNIATVLKPYLHLIDRVIRNGMESGEFSQTLDYRLGRQMVFGTIDEVVTSWMASGFKYDLLETRHGIHQMLIKGLS
ncbi:MULTISPECIES: TetR/AcrR family transcriptional regulator [Exiguobacterium]|uniref:TetR/AcrR family transcriptional regulator n=1 Tax=Exiguobacterium antarcticum TaxID=132920 RepID=A0ABT6R3L4_9BACL|nr:MULTISPECIES: TetR/AcrR family transcriptional regulator [Exiguobacterium]MCT4778803.1 TetR family transcriptional regulator [Exiguobacterium soli]MDI3235551.1 TetR/AcrR family transcriptional regulator [Exiguobacterium antarcticum]